jgi:hypothetical protein
MDHFGSGFPVVPAFRSLLLFLSFRLLGRFPVVPASCRSGYSQAGHNMQAKEIIKGHAPKNSPRNAFY